MYKPTPPLTAAQKLEFLKEIREHLVLSPEQYRYLVMEVLRKHRSDWMQQPHAEEREAA